MADGQVDEAIQKLQSLLALWHEMRGSSDMPSRADIAYGAFRPWRDHIALIDLGIDETIRFRQCGSNLGIRFGVDMTNRSLAELDNDDSNILRRAIAHTRVSGEPSEIMHERLVDRALIVFYEFCAPLADDGVTPNAKLFASYPVPGKSRLSRSTRG